MTPEPLNGWPTDFAPQLWPQRSLVPKIWPRPTIRAIIEKVAEQHHITYAALIGPSRRAEIVRTRQEAMWTVRKIGIWSLPAIGRAFGDRDHTTVLHGVRAHEKRLAANL